MEAESGKQASASGKELQIGALILGRFRIVSLLGSGAQARVYLAEDMQLDRRLAIKVFEIGNDEKAQERFKRELRILATLDQRNIVKLFQTAELADGRACLLMEHLEGVTLAALLEKEKKLAPALVLAIFKQVLPALQYLHDNNVVHRDLKPANIFLLSPSLTDQASSESLSANLEVKLLDFGIARIMNQESVQETITGAAPLGSASYMSPEQCAGKKVDARSDLYAAACIIYECLRGKRAFSADSDMEVMYKQLHQEASGLRNELSPQIAGVLARALHKDPEKRPQSANEFLDLLTAAGPTLFAGTRSAMKVNFIAAGLIVLMLSAALLYKLVFLRSNPDKEIGKEKKYSAVVKNHAATLIKLSRAAADPKMKLAYLIDAANTTGSHNRIERLESKRELIELFAAAGQFDNAFAAAEKMKQELDSWPEEGPEKKRILLDYYRALTETLLQKDEHSEALAVIAKAADALKALPEGPSRESAEMSILMQKSDALSELGKMQECENTMRDLLKRFDQNKEDPLTDRIMNAEVFLSQLMVRVNKEAEALRLMKDLSVELRVRGADNARQTFSAQLSNLANLGLELEKYELASQFLDLCQANLELCKENERVIPEGPMYYQKARICLHERENQEALANLRQAFSAFKRHKDIDLSFIITTGHYFQQLGRLKEAEAVFELALARAEADPLKATKYLDIARFMLAELSMDQKDLRKSKEILDEIERAFKQSPPADPDHRKRLEKDYRSLSALLKARQ